MSASRPGSRYRSFIWPGILILVTNPVDPLCTWALGRSGIARERLLAAGVAEVRDARYCTICDERFFSHRREGARAGRQGGVAWRS